MSDVDYASKLEEVERLLNDPDSRLDAERVWTLLDELATADGALGN